MHVSMRSALALAALSLTVVPGLKTIAKAQSLSGLPACARPALLAAIQTSGCHADPKCICNIPQIFPSLLTAIQKSCDPADQAAVETFGEKYCKSLTAGAGEPEITTHALPAILSKSTTATAGPNSEIPLPGYTLATSTPGPVTTDVFVASEKSHHKSPHKSHHKTHHKTHHKSYHKTMTYSTTTSTMKPTSRPHIGGAAETGMSAAALAVAVGAMGWVFAEF